MFEDPSRYERMKVFPKTLSLPTPNRDSIFVHDLGYASFSSPVRLDLFYDGDGTWVQGTNDSLSIIFCRPFTALPSYTNLNLLSEVFQIDHSENSSDIIRQEEKNKTELESELEREQAVLLPIFNTLTMGRHEFNSYVTKVRDKAYFRLGYAGIYTFSTARIEGLLWVGEEEDDYSAASACLQSLSGNIGLYIHFNVLSENSIESITPILSSFEFLIDSVNSL